MLKPIYSAPIAALALTGCATYSELPTDRAGAATLYYANGTPAGTAQLVGSGDALSITVAVSGMTAGPHGFHLHQTGTCTAPDFKSAGGHLNPYGKSHGHMSADGSHLGDLPNLTVKSDGVGTASAQIGTGREEILRQVFDADGTAVVIHAGPDDYISDPAGDAGSRIACGVLKRS